MLDGKVWVFVDAGEVEDAGDGTLSVKYDGNDSFETPEFENKYTAEGKAELSAKKAANANLGENTFQFELYDAEGNLLETSEEVKQGETATFKAISYELTDVGEYTYTIKEVIPEGVDENNTLNGITFSASDTETAGNESLKAAVADAKAKAEVLAEAAGLKITGIEAISEGGVVSYDNTVSNFSAKRMEEAVMDTGYGTVVQAAKLIVSASVSITFKAE